MDKLAFGMNRSLDGYFDHTALLRSPVAAAPGRR